MRDGIACEESSGNVLADLELPDPAIRLAKARLAREIGRAVTARRLEPTEAADALGLHQSDVVNIMRRRLRDYSPDRLTAVVTQARSSWTRR